MSRALKKCHYIFKQSDFDENEIKIEDMDLDSYVPAAEAETEIKTEESEEQTVKEENIDAEGERPLVTDSKDEIVKKEETVDENAVSYTNK